VRAARKFSESMIDVEIIDKRADVAAVLYHPVRRKIRDALRRHGELTLTELARTIGESEPNTHHHLSKMLQANIVVKRTARVAGRLVTFYSLSDYYHELFGYEPKPDVLPIYALFTVYVTFTILTLFVPSFIMPFYSAFGVTDVKSALMINVFGLLSSAALLVYYLAPELSKLIKSEEGIACLRSLIR